MNVKYNGHGKYPKNACSKLLLLYCFFNLPAANVVPTEGHCGVDDGGAMRRGRVKFLDTSICYFLPDFR